MSKYPFNVPEHAFDVDDWGYDSDREIDTDFFSKAELEEFAAAKHYKILEDLPGNDLEVELPGEKKEDHT